jgi:hypothetical protein
MFATVVFNRLASGVEEHADDLGPGERPRPLATGARLSGMRRALDIALILGFLAVDFLFFHDLVKAGEVTTVPQYMTGFLSILVFAICGQSLLPPRR